MCLYVCVRVPVRLRVRVLLPGCLHAVCAPATRVLCTHRSYTATSQWERPSDFVPVLRQDAEGNWVSTPVPEDQSAAGAASGGGSSAPAR